MKIQCRIIVELPFNLNVPTGKYEIGLPAGVTILDVKQNQVAAHLSQDDDGQYLLGSSDEILSWQKMGQRAPIYTQRLRTVVQWITGIMIPNEEAHVPTTGEIKAEVVGNIISANVHEERNLDNLAESEIAGWDEQQASQFARQLSHKLTAKYRLPDPVPRFLEALNHLMRHYMVRFQDFFVEEVTEQQLGGTLTKGMPIQWMVDGKLVDTVTHVGKIPAIMRGQWYDHGEQAVADFRNSLVSTTPLDSVLLLIVRARALLEKGAYRSAIIEASAALETAVARRLFRGLRSAGLSVPRCELIMKTADRFETRSKKFLKEFTGASVVELDPALWQRILNHRSAYRNRIAHSDLEPSRKEAESAVNDFTLLAEMVSKIAE